jgi:hypothetical protein
MQYGKTDAPTEVLLLVEKIMPLLLAGEHPALQTLRRQYRAAEITRIEPTGHGFYVNFLVRNCDELVRPPDFQGGNAIIEISSAPHGAGCVLFVRAGSLSMLEGYTYGDEEWREDAKVLAVREVVPIEPGRVQG